MRAYAIFYPTKIEHLAPWTTELDGQRNNNDVNVDETKKIKNK